MQNFNINRIRFNWKGNWYPNISYIKDDIVYYDGKAFVSTIGHRSRSDFYDDFYATKITQAFTITVGPDTINSNPQGHFYINGIENPSLELLSSRTYIFDQSDSSNRTFNNTANPFLFSIIKNGSLNGSLAHQIGISYEVDAVAVTEQQYVDSFTVDAVRKVYVTIPDTDVEELFYFSPNSYDLGNKIYFEYNSYWELLHDGYTWKNVWQPSTFYAEDNIIKWEGYLYQTTVSHTSNADADAGPIPDIANWKIFATSYNWLNEWTVSTYYDLGDIVTNNGIVYLCTEKHQSSNDPILGLEFDQSRWTVVVRADYWRGDWTVATRYYVDDIVKYGARTLRCTQHHVSSSTINAGLEADQSKWEIVHEGIEYKGEWADNFKYKISDIIKIGGALWKSKTNHISDTIFREDVDQNWDIFVPGVEFDKDWNPAVEYTEGDIVNYGGYPYIALQNNVNSVPSVNLLQQDTGDWELIYRAYELVGDWQNSVQYRTGDVVRNNGRLYVCIQDNLGYYTDSNINNWKLIVDQDFYRAEWEDINTVEYFIGDIVLYKGTAYRCINRHQSTASNARPDLDVSNTYWIVFIQGNANRYLAKRGDLKVYTTSPNRLPIYDTTGKILTVKNGDTVWSANDSDYIFYVTLKGNDTINTGLSLENSFRTVKHAVDQIISNGLDQYNTTVFVKHGVYMEVLPLIVPKNCAIVGDELRGTTIMPAAGYETYDMFYVRNGSGIRNLTLQGLQGTLQNSQTSTFQIPTAGAYVSLDPGLGPNDTAVHITTRSPYVQNVTTFGTGCIGLKIDGTLHDNGNRSIVANDFTQVLSDGIGIWANYLGKAELVSVFTYYCHIGYFTTNGGILRATNGNNSYGNYGSVSEGYNPTEIAITGRIYNIDNEAIVGQILSYDIINQEILSVGYEHAGQGYSSASISFAGTGVNAAASINQFRDNAISNIRIIPDSNGNIGGQNYTLVQNYARSGNETEIRLATGDDGTAADYVGQRIVINSGVGIGQYAEIIAYDDVTKIATVSRESDGLAGWDHFTPEWPIEPILSNDTRYSIEPKVTVDEPDFTQTTVNGITSWDTEVISADGLAYAWIRSTGVGSNWNITILNKSTNTSYTFNPWENGISDNANAITVSNISLVHAKIIHNESNELDPTDYKIMLHFQASYTIQIFGGPNPSYQSVPTNFYYTLKYSDGSLVHWSWKYIDTLAKYEIKLFDGYNNLYFEDTNAFYYNIQGVVTTPNTPINIADFSHGFERNGIYIATDWALAWPAYPDDDNIPVVVSYYNAYAWELAGLWYDGTFSDTINLIDKDKKIFFINNKFICTGLEDDKGTHYIGEMTDVNVGWTLHKTQENIEYINISYGNGVYVATQNTIPDGTGSTIGIGESLATIRTFDNDSTQYTTNIIIPNSSTVAYWDNAFNLRNGANYVSVVPGIRAKIRAIVSGSTITKFIIYNSGSNFTTTPTVTVYDNLTSTPINFTVYKNNGVLGPPSITNRGTGYVTATATITGNGYAEIYQTGSLIKFSNISEIPSPGANILIAGINDVYRITRIEGTQDNITSITINPSIDIENSPTHFTTVQIRSEYSQIRLTFHDFLDIGTGNKNSTNYPDLYLQAEQGSYLPVPANEVVESDFGRVFYVSTDQDGNFRVGELYAVEQATGIVTINAGQFDLAGLTELSLGAVRLGGTNAVVREFSTETKFVADSNEIVPTQRAIKTFLDTRIGGGGSNPTANILSAGSIIIQNNEISSATNEIKIITKTNIKSFKGHLLAQMFM